MKTLIISLAVLLLLAGCAQGDIKVSTPNLGDISLDYIEIPLPSGRVIPCLYGWSGDGRGGPMLDCDWSNR